MFQIKSAAICAHFKGFAGTSAMRFRAAEFDLSVTRSQLWGNIGRLGKPFLRPADGSAADEMRNLIPALERGCAESQPQRWPSNQLLAASNGIAVLNTLRLVFDTAALRQWFMCQVAPGTCSRRKESLPQTGRAA